jgi:hypothetical protein
MKAWPRNPRIYEINTWVWLQEFSQQYQRPVSLAEVPAAEWDALASWGFDAVWLMGVWERSPAGRNIALQDANLLNSFRDALPDYTTNDIAGSPYCVRQYTVAPSLGGNAGLAVAREELKRRGMGLILDLVPNHVAPDHPWVRLHPKYFIHGGPEDLAREPQSFFQAGDQVLARGRDPYFPPWPDVIQVNAFSPGYRQALTDTLMTLAGQCDGVRCDMAMLLVNRIFRQTWGERAGEPPGKEFWEEVIPAVKGRYPQFRFIAEAYWDMEWELQSQGFDYCYDKRLYDRLEHEGAEAVRQHLLADLSYQEKLVRFIENHDEPRAAAIFGTEPARAAAVTIATLPGAKLYHQGQFQGRRVRLPVFLGRQPEEPVDAEIQEFYRKLLAATAHPVFREGRWRLCERWGWPDNQSCLNIVSWGWQLNQERRFIVVNLSPWRSQGLAHLPENDLAGKTFRLTDALTETRFDRDGADLANGFFVDLEPWQFHLFLVETISD